jgi:hypothetical protein
MLFMCALAVLSKPEQVAAFIAEAAAGNGS